LNSKEIKKLRKYSRVAWKEYVKEIKKYPFKNRLLYCWYILFGKG